MLYSLENNSVKLALDESGKLKELTNLNMNHNYAGNLGIWRIIYQQGQELEKELLSENYTPEISTNDKEIKISYRIDTSIKLELILNGSLENNNFIFDIDINNLSEECVISEFQFGVRNCQFDNHKLYWSYTIGEKFDDVGKTIDQCFTYYMAQDNKAVEKSSIYPGRSGMNFYMLVDDESERGVYLGSHDLTFQKTLHLMRKRQDQIDMMMVKYPFVKPGESTRIEGFILSPFEGSWHRGADIYRDWSKSWLEHHETPDWIKKMNGWQRIILRHQYGEQLFKYQDLPKIFDDGIKAGIDTLFMFAWHTEGHDAGYPNYSYDESQGGFKELKSNVKKFQDAGGKVILYFNGKLIDMSSDFYREKGKIVSEKRWDGSEYNDFYRFGGAGTSLKAFGNRSFVNGCPGCPEWVEVLKGCIDQAIALECDAVFFDQLGMNCEPCYDESHRHPVPFMTAEITRAKMLKELREYINEKSPGMALGIEVVSDITANQVDFVHSWGTFNFYPMYRYIFPDFILSDREIRDDNDIERRVNHAILRGYRSDVEIYRCRATIAETPHYQGYLKKANDLRQKYCSLLLEGQYQDNQGFDLQGDEGIDAKAFKNNDKMAVAITHELAGELEGKLKVSGYKYVEESGIGDYSLKQNGESIDIKISKNSLIVVILQKI
jgi:hypothetical protein